MLTADANTLKVLCSKTLHCEINVQVFVNSLQCGLFFGFS